MKKLLITMMVAFMSLGMNAQISQKDFKDTPAQWCNHVIWGWTGVDDKQTLDAELDAIQERGFRNIIIDPGKHDKNKYPNEGWFQLVKIGVQEAKKRGMKIWIIDEAGYPSGTAGGRFTAERPDLCMQALVNKQGKVEHEFKTSQTRSPNNPTGKKDESISLMDYLNPKATQQFIEWTFEPYKKVLGKELGNTVLGFRGDEPAYSHVPWTDGIRDTFISRKGYDPVPYYKAFFPNVTLNEKECQVKADYWDVWSQMFADNYFKPLGDWCAGNGVQYITHLDKDDDLPWCMRMQGDPFRCLSKVQIPGVDVIWTQIWPWDKENDFPKLASSIAHVYGRQRAFSESFAAWRAPLTMETAKYVLDFQLARGINFFEFMFWPDRNHILDWMKNPGMPQLNAYANRAVYMMSQGKPSAKIALYTPVPTLWMGNTQVDSDLVKVEHELLRHQYDFDNVSDEGISEAMTVHNGFLENKSGQQYTTLVIPSTDVLTKAAWKRIREFAQRGGRVLFWGKQPTKLVEKTFTALEKIDTMSEKCFIEPDLNFTQTVQSAMPGQELQVKGTSSDSIRYTARQLDGEKIYFIFNQASTAFKSKIVLDEVGRAQLWNANTGTVSDLNAEVVDGKTQLQLELGKWEAKILVVTRQKKEYDITRYGATADKISTSAIQSTIDVAAKNGGGTVVIPKGVYLSGALFFKRGVHLRVEEGAILRSVVDTAAYPQIDNRLEGINQKGMAAFLNFNDCDGVQVSGKGTIDGQGLVWKKYSTKLFGRPKLIIFNHCDGGCISDVHLLNQAFWCLHLLYTDHFKVDGVNIEATDYIPSSDGIDIDSSTRIQVSGIHVKAHDDCISIKSGKGEDGRRTGKPSEDILIEHCHFDYGHGGVAMGSEVSGGIRRVMVRNCDMSGENWNPCRFKSQPSRGGYIENITFENIDIKNARNIIEVEMEWRMKGETDPPYFPRTRIGNITFRNIKAVATNAGVIHGYPESPIPADAIHFENCDFHALHPFDIRNAEVTVPQVK